MDQLVDGEARERARRQDPRGRRDAARGPTRSKRARHHRRLRALRRRTDIPVPTPPFWGVREIEVDLDEVYPHLDTHVLFKLHWGGRGVKGEEWSKLVDEDFRPRLERMWREPDLPAPARAARLLPVLQRGQRDRRARPRGPRDRARAPLLPAPAQGRPHLPGRLLPPEGLRRARRRRAAGRHRRRRGHRADGQARAGRRVRRAALRPRPRRADRRGHGRVAALAVRERPRHRPPTQGRRYSWGYPACPSSPSTRRSTACSTRRRSACA